MVSGKVKLALVLLGFGFGIGMVVGYGIIRIPQPRLMFELMTLLMFIYLAIWGIRKRMEKKRR